jgi:hypothetical protein
MKKLHLVQLYNQVKRDLIGKDAYRGATLSYAWIANQFGHFSLGFIPSFIFYLLLKHHSTLRYPAFWAAVMVSVFWLLFEIANLVLPIIKERRQRNQKQAPFKTPWDHLIFDTATDLFFFWLGACCLPLLVEYSPAIMIATGVLIAILLYPIYYWYVCKIYLQNARFPFHMRLSQWDFFISAADLETVRRFIRSREPHHLLVFGDGRSGKTSMGVAIAHEASMRKQRCYYIPAIKLMAQCGMSDKEIIKVTGNQWTWRKAGLLVIDDFHPGQGALDDFVEVDTFFKQLTLSSLASSNLRALKQQQVIWVLGDEGADQQIQRHWEYCLQQLGVEPGQIDSIHLHGARMNEKQNNGG